MTTVEERFAAYVLSCVDDINKLLPGLASHYPPMAVVAALAAHLGGALRIHMECGACSPEQASLIIQHVREVAFD